MTVSDDGRVVLTGGDNGLVIFRWTHSLLVANTGPRTGLECVLDGADETIPPFLCPVRSLLLTQQERLLIVGLENGEVRIIAQDSEYLRERLMCNLEDIGFITFEGDNGQQSPVGF
jgi:hypothetical protein